MKSDYLKLLLQQPEITNNEQPSTKNKSKQKSINLLSKKQQEIEFRKAIERLADLGGFQYNTLQDKFYLSETGNTIYGISDKELFNLENFISLHQSPENETLHLKFQDAIETGRHFQLEIKTANPNPAKQKQIRITCSSEKSRSGIHKIWGTIQDITLQKEEEQDKIQTEIQKQQMILETEVWKYENVRGWISHELHEDIAQILVAARNHLRFPLSNGKSNSAQIYLKEAGEFLEEAIQKIKTLYENLDVPNIKLLGLQGCIAEMINKQNLEGKTKLIFHNRSKRLEQLEESIKIVLYRIIKEKLNNITKHAKAANGWVLIECESNNILIIVRDDGIGFNNSERHWRNGLSMTKNIIEARGGEMMINSSPGKGCEFIGRIPVGKKNINKN